MQSLKQTPLAAKAFGVFVFRRLCPLCSSRLRESVACPPPMQSADLFGLRRSATHACARGRARSCRPPLPTSPFVGEEDTRPRPSGTPSNLEGEFKMVRGPQFKMQNSKLVCYLTSPFFEAFCKKLHQKLLVQTLLYPFKAVRRRPINFAF